MLKIIIWVIETTTRVHYFENNTLGCQISGEVLIIWRGWKI